MEQLRQAIRQMIETDDLELNQFLAMTSIETFKRQDILSPPKSVPNKIFFILEGILRVLIVDKDGIEHTIHFALENQFIADYSSFILQQESLYSLQALETMRVVAIPRSAIEWGYQNLKEGQKLGRLVAEYYFVYHDNRIKNLYARSPRERYDTITDVFPNIHNRVPQHMIASYLGVSPVHLSRLKKPSR